MFHLFRKNTPFFPTFSWGDLLVLGSGVSAFVLLATATIGKFSIWFDEAFGSYLIRFDFADLTRYTANDVHPPLYYWLLKLWSLAFGNTEVGIRSMSIFFGAITIVFAFLLVLKLFGRRAAYTSMLLLVISPMFIRYGQEARMYTLLTAIIVAATYVLVFATETKKRVAWVVYGVLVALGMLTQYFAALAWISHLVWRYLTTRKKGDSFKQGLRRTVDKNLIVSYSTAILLFCFWLPFLVIQFLTIQGHGFWIKPLTTTTIPDFLTNVMLFSDSTGVVSWLALAFYLLLGLVIYLVYRLLGSLPDDTRQSYLLFLCMVIIPPIILVIMSMPPLRPAFVDRYLMTSVIFIPLLIGVTLSLSRDVLGKWRTVGVLLVVIVMMGMGIVNQSVTGNYNKASGQSNNTRQLLEAVRAKAPAGTPILTTTPWIFYEAAIYDNPDSPIYYINETTEYKYGSLTALAENERHKIRDLDAFAGEHRSIWVIANLHDVPPRPLRDNWREQDSIVINDDMTGKPLFKATHFTVE